jgi:hypothetical protein
MRLLDLVTDRLGVMVFFPLSSLGVRRTKIFLFSLVLVLRSVYRARLTIGLINVVLGGIWS